MDAVLSTRKLPFLLGHPKGTAAHAFMLPDDYIFITFHISSQLLLWHLYGFTVGNRNVFWAPPPIPSLLCLVMNIHWDSSKWDGHRVGHRHDGKIPKTMRPSICVLFVGKRPDTHEATHWHVRLDRREHKANIMTWQCAAAALIGCSRSYTTHPDV